MSLPASQLQVLPTRAPLQGETAILVGLRGEHSNLNGITCFCGAYANSLENPSELCFWVTFQRPDDSSCPEDPDSALESMGMIWASVANLAALPDPPPGAPRAVLDACNAPPAALAPLAASPEEESALLFSKSQTLASMMDEMGRAMPECSAASDTVDDLRSAMEEAGKRVLKFRAPPGCKGACKVADPSEEDEANVAIGDEPSPWALACALRASRLGLKEDTHVHPVEASTGSQTPPPLTVLDRGGNVQEESEENEEDILPRRLKRHRRHHMHQGMLEGIPIAEAQAAGPQIVRKRLRRLRFRVRGKQPDILQVFS